MRRFFKWWFRELATVVPVALQPTHHKRLDSLEIEIGAEYLKVAHRVGRKLKPLGQLKRRTTALAASDTRETEFESLQTMVRRKFKAEKTKIVLSVPRQHVLTKVISLPLAAEENLRSVLGYEMNRVSPFKAEDVFFEGKITQRTPATKRLEVTLNIAPCNILNEALRLTEAWDQVSDQRETQISIGNNNALITLVPPIRTAKMAVRLNALLFAMNIAAMSVLIALPIIKQNETLNRLNVELAEVKEVAAEASQLRERLSQSTDAVAYLDKIKNAKPPAVVLLESLSKNIPDTTWLNRLEIKEEEVHVAGFSATTSALIAQLERAEEISEVRFVSPVSQDARTGKERFHLGAKIVKVNNE